MAASAVLAWLKAKLLPGRKLPPHMERATQLIAAIDAGGIPLNAVRVNHIARELGLDVSPSAAMADTIARIRAAVQTYPD